MHLQRGLTTLNTGKPKFKLTKAKEANWREDLAIYNRDLKRQGLPRLTWEEYVDMRLGKVKTKVKEFKPLTTAIVRPVEDKWTAIPSLNSFVGDTSKRETLKYDGERKLLGIAVMHKSNLVPVFDEEQAKEISQMRRG
jgi:hypothetical protein